MKITLNVVPPAPVKKLFKDLFDGDFFVWTDSNLDLAQSMDQYHVGMKLTRSAWYCFNSKRIEAYQDPCNPEETFALSKAFLLDAQLVLVPVFK